MLSSFQHEQHALAGNRDSHLFGVFDGHGEVGDVCSFFAANMFPVCLEKQLVRAGGSKAFEEEGMEKIYAKTFTETNRLLRRAKNIDDSLSGTTGITIIVKGDVLYVANVGDSRAIIGSTNKDGNLLASCLSNDQTPFRKDERERLKKKGALIRTMDQLEGKESLHENWDEGEGTGDPPRVWNSSKQVPGCAFTRSIGDAVAENIGVYAIPEILIWNLGPNDHYVIIASDGVFEFLSNQQVLDLVNDNEDDLVMAAKKIVEKSYYLWLEIDQRTDDITVIIIRISDVVPIDTQVKATQFSRAFSNHTSSLKTPTVARPVRRTINKRRQKVISEYFDFQEEGVFDVEANTTEKSANELARIYKMLENNFLFKSLPTADKDILFKVMKKQKCSVDEVIIKEGDVGDVMYIIDDGEFMVHKLTETTRDDGTTQTENLLLFTYTSEGATFGELSLLYGKPRGATITCKVDGHLWSISKRAFRAVLMKKKKCTMEYLRNIKIFSDQKYVNLQRLSQASLEESIGINQVVCSQYANNDSWVILLILSGAVELISDKTDIQGEKRFEGSFIVRDEIGRDFQEAVARDEKVKIARIPLITFIDVIGQNSLNKLATLTPSLFRSHNESATSLSETKCADILYKHESSHDYLREKVAFTIGGFGYIGIYKHKERGLSCLKVIAKVEAEKAKVETCVVHEREILLLTKGIVDFVPNLISSFQDDRYAYLVYEEIFVCDLSTTLMYTDLSIANKIFYAACILKAIISIHEFGIVHRFINSNSIYVTASGFLRVVDFRYCKKMDGMRSYTICGDPLFIAPEMISQTGYDYGVDFWAYGCLMYEIFDGESPFSAHQMEETTLFKAITHHRVDNLKPSKRIPSDVFDMIKCLINPVVNDRIGYKNSRDIVSQSCFNDIRFTKLSDDASKVIAPGEHTPDLSRIFVIENAKHYKSTVYNDWR